MMCSPRSRPTALVSDRSEAFHPPYSAAPAAHANNTPWSTSPPPPSPTGNVRLPGRPRRLRPHPRLGHRAPGPAPTRGLLSSASVTAKGIALPPHRGGEVAGCVVGEQALPGGLVTTVVRATNPVWWAQP